MRYTVLVKPYNLKQFYQDALSHKVKHSCTAVPYAEGQWLSSIVKSHPPLNILEVGTGVGYSTACMVSGSPDSVIETIDKNEEHLRLAIDYWVELGINKNITIHLGKVEDILPTLTKKYDFIFYDGHVPQKKLVRQFYDLLPIEGVLVTANLYLVDIVGGSYVRQLKDVGKWKTDFFSDTALSIKRR